MSEREPGVGAALERLVDPATRGDPESPLRWTSKSTRALAEELLAQGHSVAPRTVAKLLHESGYSLQATRKTREGRDHPDRDAQFRYLTGQVNAHLGRGDPAVSVDTKKKELVGRYENGGREWQPKGEPEQVEVYDFIGEAGKAIPYGVYDVAANAAWVSVGRDHDTAAFAVATLHRLVAGDGPPALPARLRAADLRRRRRVQRIPGPAVEGRTRRLRRPNRPDDHRLPPTARDVKVEQNRASAVQPHLDELARALPGKP